MLDNKKEVSKISIINRMRASSKNLEIPKTFTSSSTGMDFILIPAGEFMMGSSDYEVGRYVNEGKVREVIIKSPFNLGKHPVTQKQWVAIMGDNPSYFKGDEMPVENVSWNDVQRFIIKLNDMEETDKYRLPSEAEWEYTCRAGTTTKFYFGDDESKIGDYAWYSGNSDSETHPIGQKKPNHWGIYDMYGNVWEWVQDKWHDKYNEVAPSDGSAWRDENNFSHVVRGGSWDNNADGCRSATRYKSFSGDCSYNIGFRLLRKM